MPGFHTIHLRLKTIKVYLLAALLLSSFLLMAGTSQAYGGAGQISSNDANPNNNSASEDTAVPPLAELTVASFPLTSLYDKLLDIDTGGNLVPELATGWTVSPDGTTYTLVLRENVQFHDGTLLNALAVKFNMENTVELFPDLMRTSLLGKGIISQVNTPDSLTVEVVLPAADPGFLQMLTGLDGMIVSPPIPAISTAASDPVGAGPFEFGSLTPFSRLNLQAFPDYWGGQPQVSTLTFFYVPEEATRLALLLVQQAQVATYESQTIFDRLSRDGFGLCGSPPDFQGFLPTLTGFECFPDKAMRFENVSGLSTLGVGLANFEDGPVPPPGADLSVSKSDDADPVMAGDTLIYTVQVDNAGPLDATGVVVTDTLPAGVTFVSTAGCAEDPNGVPTCSLGTILSGGSTQFTVTVNVDADTSGTIINRVDVSGNEVDPNPSNNSDIEDTMVLAEADLSITKLDSIDPVIAGDQLTYTVQVDNAGPSDATGVVVTDTLPVGVKFVSTTGCAEDPNGVPTCSLGTILANGSAQFTITVDVGAGTSGTITNRVDVSGSETDPNPDNNSDTEDTIVTPVCRLDLTLSLVEGTLTMDFILGTSGPANWGVWLSIPNFGFVQLWTAPLPPIPTTSFPVPIPGFPSLGTVGFLTALIGPGGVTCFDVAFIDTGTPSTANPTLEELRELIPNNAIALPSIGNSN